MKNVSQSKTSRQVWGLWLKQNNCRILTKEGWTSIYSAYDEIWDQCVRNQIRWNFKGIAGKLKSFQQHYQHFPVLFFSNKQRNIHVSYRKCLISLPSTEAKDKTGKAHHWFFILDQNVCFVVVQFNFCFLSPWKCACKQCGKQFCTCMVAADIRLAG